MGETELVPDLPVLIPTGHSTRDSKAGDIFTSDADNSHASAAAVAYTYLYLHRLAGRRLIVSSDPFSH